jgi:acid phosphatase type 7
MLAPFIAAFALAVSVSVSVPAPATLLAAGDIGSCASSGDEGTAALLGGLPGTVAALGDVLYDGGYDSCYAWAQFESRTRPAVGNHDYRDDGKEYFGYWGPRFGTPSTGWYSYNLGAWHVVVLNSNCAIVGCVRGSPQERWLRADLAAHRAFCTLAYWHHPRFSSGPHGDNTSVSPLWNDLYASRADVVLSGHDHDYERFAPQTASGRLNPTRGIREFVVGTGGRSSYSFVENHSNSESRLSGVNGVLRLTLSARRYSWRFIRVDGQAGDAGSAPCH